MPKSPNKPKSRKPLSLYPLSMDEALRIAMTGGKRGTFTIDDDEREFQHFLEGLPDSAPSAPKTTPKSKRKG